MADRTVRVRLEAAVAGFQAQMNQAAATTRQTSQRIQGHVRDNAAAYQTAGMAAGAMGVAAAAGIKSVLSAGADFQQGMNQVKAVSGATGAEFEQLSDQAKELGSSTRFSATEAADGLGFLAMAGFDATQATEALPGVLELASAGMMDLGTAADIASNVLTGYGMAASDIGRVNDVLAGTFTTTNTDLRQLGEAMKMAAPVANAAGIEFEEAAAAIGLMGNAGIQGSMAGTSLRGAITRLLNPADDAAAILEKLGLNATEADGSLIGLDEIVRTLADSGATTGEMMKIFGQRAGPAMAALVSQGADALVNQTQTALDSTGKAAEIAETQMEGLSGSFTELRSASEGLKISLFESGAGRIAEGMVDTMTGVIRTLDDMPPAAHGAVMGVGGLTAVFGTVGGAALILAPRIVSTMDAVKQLGGVSGMARGGLSGLARFGLHPVTIALGLAAGAAVGFAREKAEAARKTDEFVASLDEDTAAITENTRETVANQLATDGLIDVGKNYGLSSKTMVDAILGEEDALRRVRHMVADNTSEQDGYTRAQDRSTSHAERLSDALLGIGEGHSEAAREARNAAEAEAEASDRYLDTQHAIDSGLDPALASHVLAQQKAADQSGDTGAAVAGMGDDFDETGGEVDAATEALDAYVEAIARANSPVLQLRDAVDKRKDAEKELELALAGSEEATMSAEEAAWNLFEATEAEESAALDTELSFEAFQDRLDRFGGQSDTTRGAVGLLEEGVDDLRGAGERWERKYEGEIALQNLRTTHDGVVDLRAAAMRAAGTYTLRFNYVEGGGPDGKAAAIRAQRAASAGGRSTGGFVEHEGGFAGTGPLRASGALAADEVPTVLQKGEFVLSRSMVQQLAVASQQPSGLAGGGARGGDGAAAGRSMTYAPTYVAAPSAQQEREHLVRAEVAMSRGPGR